MDSSWISLVPPFTTLITAILTKRILPSLVFGLLAGGVLLSKNLFTGVITAATYLAHSLSSLENAYVILFLFLFGSLTEIIKLSGGIKGFSQITERYVKSERSALLSVWLLSIITFLDCCFHVIAVGTITKPLIEKVSGSKEKLAMVLNVTSSQLVVLIPIGTTYVGYIIGILGSAMKTAGVSGSTYALYLKSLPFNFYSLGMVALAFIIGFWDLGFGKQNSIKSPDKEEGVHNEQEAHEQCEFEEQVRPRPINLFFPIVLVLGLILFLFWWTGGGATRSFFQAITHAQFEKSILIATFAALVISTIIYALQHVPLAELDSHILKGGTELLPPIIILILSWSVSSITRDLGFVSFAKSTLEVVPVALIPVTMFLISGGTSYFIGSSWATWALVIPLGLPLAFTAGASLPVTIGAMLAGGSIGDNISPLGETPILTATITEVPIIQHVQSMLRYALAVSALSIAAYFIISLL